MVTRAAVVIVAVLAGSAGPAGADPACDPIVAALDADARRARYWNTGWAIGFGAAAVGVSVAALTIPEDKISDDTRTGLWITAGKATIGALARIVIPLRIEQPTSCADAPRALAASARRERNSFWLNILGGLALNVGGLLYLGLREDAWRTGAISFGTGTTVGVISALTAPRTAWRGKDRLLVAPTLGGLVLAGTW